MTGQKERACPCCNTDKPNMNDFPPEYTMDTARLQYAGILDNPTFGGIPMKTVKIAYESYDTPHDSALRERTLSLTMENEDADKLLRVRTPYNRTENITLDGDRLYTSLWSMEHLMGRYMILGCKVLSIDPA